MANTGSKSIPADGQAGGREGRYHMRVVLWIMLLAGLFFAIGGFATVASDIQLGIAVTGIVTFSVAFQGLGLPGSKFVGWVSLVVGALFFFVGLEVAASDFQIQVACSGLALAASGAAGLVSKRKNRE